MGFLSRRNEQVGVGRPQAIIFGARGVLFDSRGEVVNGAGRPVADAHEITSKIGLLVTGIELKGGSFAYNSIVGDLFVKHADAANLRGSISGLVHDLKAKPETTLAIHGNEEEYEAARSIGCQVLLVVPEQIPDMPADAVIGIHGLMAHITNLVQG